MIKRRAPGSFSRWRLFVGLVGALPVAGRCQSCGGTFQLSPNSGFSGYYAYENVILNPLQQFTAAQLPVSGGFVGAGSQPTMSTSYTFNSLNNPDIWAAVLLNWAQTEGQDISMAIHWGFQSTVNTSYFIAGTCPSNSFYVDRLEQEAFLWNVEVVDQLTGTYRLVLTDNPADPGDFTVGSRSSTVNYSLTKNQAVVGTGALSSKFVSSPPSFVFSGLTAGGNYVLSFSSPTPTTNVPYLYELYNGSWPAFAVPAPGDNGTNLSLRVWLQGATPTSGTLMNDGLRSLGLIPTVEPYSGLGYTYVGATPGTSIAPALLAVTGNDAVVDWIAVELRNTTTPTQLVYSLPALVQRDGDVMGTDGDPYVSFPVPAGNYRIAVRHRNHLGVLTASASSLATVMNVVDLRTTVLYGTNAMGSNSFLGNCLWAGDATGDGSLKYTGSGNDRDPIILAVGGTTPNNTVSNVYDRRDTNLDGVIKYTGANNDRDVILLNVGSTTPNSIRTQQLP